MNYTQFEPRSSKNQYRCSAKHLAMLKAIQEQPRKYLFSSKPSIADIIEQATNVYYEKLLKQKAADFKIK